MSNIIKTFNMGSCHLHDPADIMSSMGFFPDIFRDLDFNCSPYVLSSGAAIQLYDFSVGERVFAEPIDWLFYAHGNPPRAETRRLVEATEIALVELSTPFEPMIGEAIVNFHWIQDSIITPLRAAGVDAHLLSGWERSLVNAKPDLEDRARALLASWPEDIGDGDGEVVRFAVEKLHCRQLSVDDMVHDLQRLGERLGAPMAMMLYTFRYMPDGRPIDWPAGFKRKQIEVAQRLELPTLDFAPIVAKHGAPRMIQDDLRHWKEGGLALQAELLYDFLAELLGRPHLEAYPEWLEARPGLFDELSDLVPISARESFPGLMSFPIGSGFAPRRRSP